MGNLYKSLTRNQNLLPVVQNIQKYMDEKRKQENLKKFLDLLQGTKRGIENIYEPPPPKSSQPSAPEQTIAPTQFSVDKPVKLSDLTRQQQPSLGNLSPQVPTEQNLRNLLPQLSQGDETTGTTETKKPIRETTLSDKNKEANRQLADFLYKMATMPGGDIPLEKQQLGADMLSQIIKGEQTPESEYYNLGKGQKRYERTGTGEDRVVAENIVDEPVDYDIEGKFENEDTGTYWTYDKLTGKPIDTNIPYDKSKGSGLSNSESLSREKFEYQKKEDAKKETEKKEKAQSKRNQIMDSYKTVEELRKIGWTDKKLIKYGIVREGKEGEETKIYNNVGGAYVYNDDKGQEQIFPATEDVEERIKKYADEQAYDAPNKWGREKNSSGEDKKKPKIEY